MCAVVLLLGCTQRGWALSGADVRSLILLEWRPVTDIVVEKAEWLADGTRVAVGGWTRWPDQCAVGVYPVGDGTMQLCPGAASPHFAVSPDGVKVAYWREVPVEAGSAAELSVLDVSGPVISTLGAPRSKNAGMHLGWLSDQQILFTFQRSDYRSGALFIADLRGGAPIELLRKDDGVWQGLRPVMGPAIIAEFLSETGVTRYHVSLTPSGQPSVTPANPSQIATEPASFELEQNGQLVYNKSAAEGVIVDKGVGGLCMSPDRSAVLYTKGRDLMAAGSGEPRGRQLKHLEDGAYALAGCSWSPGTSSICAWGKAGNTGKLWYGVLGTETVTCRFEFGPQSGISPGNKLWVAARFYLDEKGDVREPDWTTLKGAFVVTRVLRGTDRVIVEAESLGSQTGIVARMTGSDNPPEAKSSASHIRIGVNAQQPAQWMYSFVAEVLPDRAGWLENSTEVGKPLTIAVTRQVLMPLGPQPQ